MIPASYLFKDIYAQHWTEPTTVLQQTEQPQSNKGLFIAGPMAGFANLLRQMAQSATDRPAHHTHV